MYKPKRSTIVFVAILFVLVSWPILTIFNRVKPIVFGLPLCVFWPLFIFAILTIGMIILYYTAEKEDE